MPDAPAFPGRPSGRRPDELRPVTFERAFGKHAEGACLVSFGETKVLCTATVETDVPRWMRGSGRGWVTAEYAMLPRATNSRTQRERRNGVGGRTQEIQRLIGRSLRAVTDLGKLGEMSIKVDCDVLQADGGTRTASITGAFIALHEAIRSVQTLGMVADWPLRDHVAAISCGIYQGGLVLDLDYDEDSNADADANFVLTGDGGLVEIQGTAEGQAFSRGQFLELLDLAEAGVKNLIQLQKAYIAQPA